jgi:hypothetical protein
LLQEKKLSKLNESLVLFVEAFVKAIELTLSRHRELAAKLLVSFAVQFCEIGHSPYIGQAVFKDFRKFSGAFFSGPLRFEGEDSVDVFSGADVLSILRRAYERILFVRDDIESFNVRVLQMKVNAFGEDIKQGAVDGVLTLSVDFWNTAVREGHEHHLQKKIEHHCLLRNLVAYVLGRCSMMCMRSIPENQHEHDNGFMVEQAGVESAKLQSLCRRASGRFSAIQSS